MDFRGGEGTRVTEGDVGREVHHDHILFKNLQIMSVKPLIFAIRLHIKYRARHAPILADEVEANNFAGLLVSPMLLWSIK